MLILTKYSKGKKTEKNFKIKNQKTQKKIKKNFKPKKILSKK